MPLLPVEQLACRPKQKGEGRGRERKVRDLDKPLSNE